ncbi:MAG TPA: hypothetical protein VNA23_06625 [Anaerolineales bacterium]|nr:hypothetical protein [Anaerolineales bacterium]
MDDLLTPREQDLIIEDALRSYPLASMPQGITDLVLARIRAEPAPRFKLTRNDYVLTVVLSLVLGAMLFALQSLPPYALLQIRIQGILLWQSFLINYRWLVPLTSIMLGASLAGFAFLQLLRPQRLEQ